MKEYNSLSTFQLVNKIFEKSLSSLFEISLLDSPFRAPMVLMKMVINVGENKS